MVSPTGYRTDRSFPVLQGVFLDGRFSSITILYFCLLLPLILAGCGIINPTLEKTIVPHETIGLTLTEQSSTVLPPSQTPQPSWTSPPTYIPCVTPTSHPTPSSTPLFTFDQSRYDRDLFQPLDVSHNPPLIARPDETVSLVFGVVNPICFSQPLPCSLVGVLHYSYGESEPFQSIPLTNEIVDEMDSLVARLPAVDQTGGSLRYYVEFAVPQASYVQTYPGEGTIYLFTTNDFIPVELPDENAVAPGDVVYDFFWGYGPDRVRQGFTGEYLTRVGPTAIDVAGDGRIAILDPVNERILIFEPGEASYSSYDLPFANGYYSDLAFDQEGRLTVCDFQGEEVEDTRGPDPYCYLLTPDGKLSGSTPVYVRSPSKMTREMKILDYYDSRLVAPFNSQGQAHSREIQRQKHTWEYPLRYVEGQDPFVAHYADVKAGVAYEVHSASPLGVLTNFERIPQGYMMTFSLGDRIRAVWINPAGIVQKDITLPKGTYSEINFNGQVAVGQDGSLYLMSSTSRGIEVHYVIPPTSRGE